MEYTRLGNSGLMVSRFAYGNSITAGDQVEEQVARSCVHAALESGITTFDTADVYADGAAELILGRALADHPREDVVICTKVGRSKRADPNAGRLSRKHIRDSIDGSLSRLGTDYVDLYQAHRFDNETPLEETMQAFADVVRAGKALYIGVSEWPAAQVELGAKLAAELSIPLVSSQCQYSLLWRVIETDLIPACDRLGIGQIAWSPLAGGVLTGKYRPGEAPPQSSRATLGIGAKSLGRWDFLNEVVLRSVARLAPLAEEAGLTVAQLALAWILRNPSVSSTIVGASRPSQLRENLRGLSVVLEDDLVRRVEEAVAPAVRSDPRLTADPLGPAARFAPQPDREENPQ
ncbi:MAG: aldo/keto reductase family protein [Actinocatenispora sp.]